MLRLKEDLLTLMVFLGAILIPGLRLAVISAEPVANAQKGLFEKNVRIVIRSLFLYPGKKRNKPG